MADNPVLETEMEKLGNSAQENEIAEKASWVAQQLGGEILDTTSIDASDYPMETTYDEEIEVGKLSISMRTEWNKIRDTEIIVEVDGDTVFRGRGDATPSGYTPTPEVETSSVEVYNPGEWEDGLGELYGEAQSKDFEDTRNSIHGRALEELQKSRENGIESWQSY